MIWERFWNGHTFAKMKVLRLASLRIFFNHPPVIGEEIMRTPSTKNSRTITATEVEGWVGKSRNSKIGKVQFHEIAAGLTRLRWPSDPEPPPGSNSFENEALVVESYDGNLWDFSAVTAAAKTLLKNAPAMLSFWEEQRWAPQTREGFDAIENLGEALFLAMPYIEWPLGYYDGKASPKRPKPWHVMALVIAKLVINSMVAAGQVQPGITRNSVVARIVHRALARMNFPGSKMITPTAIGAHLTRWDRKYGLTPSSTAALTTKHASRVCDHDLPHVASYPLSSDTVAWRQQWLREKARAQKRSRPQRKIR
jgi:hypothetical protein